VLVLAAGMMGFLLPHSFDGVCVGQHSRCISPLAVLDQGPQLDTNSVLGCAAQGPQLDTNAAQLTYSKRVADLGEYELEASLKDGRTFQVPGAAVMLLKMAASNGKPLLRRVASRTGTGAPTMADDGADTPTEVSETATPGSSTLEQKMASWDATEEEARSKTLGGNLPLVGMPGLPGRMTRNDQPDKLDGFDVFMNLSGLILFPLAILLFAAPFVMGNIDVSSVGPPPTQ